MSLNVLLVEDSPGDVRPTQEAFRSVSLSVRLHLATDGAEAMAFLKHEEPYGKSPRPDLTLLDLNLPKMDGSQLLIYIKQDPDLKTMPTIILTTSNEEGDIEKSYGLQANCYLTKPVRLEEFESLVKSVNDFWLTKVSLPFFVNQED